jgi:hypothetical protein
MSRAAAERVVCRRRAAPVDSERAPGRRRAQVVIGAGLRLRAQKRAAPAVTVFRKASGNPAARHSVEPTGGNHAR